ncbi:DNA-directed RNA polymerase 3 largest subunit [Reticulomyxa filosa]|uniref:DNA-directed RNA polymerase 3 largest subunit n=1 Tax=Reticulomyxa filosa TaxID=46433 RepID=X6MNI7_RETFI|nr:DNA-directed RNA polymerase 3 largest subunit [Reticulomyxa filosa]|eukprot:ETO15236.1 DNA-directed RNA polymerase 3 largest subunit [Reticulomyxa filosa]
MNRGTTNEEKVEETKEEGLGLEQQVQTEIGSEQQRSETKPGNSVNINDSDDDINNNNNNNDDDVQLNQMRSSGNDDINKDSGNTKEHVMIKHVIRGGGTKTEMLSANNDDDNVDADPKEPQKVEDIVAIFNQLNMDELLAQQLDGEKFPLIDASSLPHETTNTSIDKEDSTVMVMFLYIYFILLKLKLKYLLCDDNESAANSNSYDNAETEQDKDTDLILAIQLEMKMQMAKKQRTNGASGQINTMTWIICD